MHWKQHEDMRERGGGEQNDKENWRGGKSRKINEQVR